MSCLNCPKRTIGCHGKCEEYLKKVEEQKEIYKDRERGEIEAAYSRELMTRMWRRKKQKGEV